MERKGRFGSAPSLLLTSLLALVACKGPAGPPGPPGPAGPPGPGGGAAVLLLTGTAAVADASLTRYGMLTRENQQDFKEPTVLFALPRGGTLKNMYVSPTSAIETAGATVEITVRINQADTALSLTHTQADGTAVLSDTTTTVAVNAGDRISMRFRETAGLDPIVSAGTQANYNVTLELH